MREPSVRGPSVDLSEFERRLRGGKAGSAAGSDPLSELARLMEGDEQAPDPYSQILPDPRVARNVPPPVPPVPPAPAAAPSRPAWEERLRGSYDAAPSVAPEPPYYQGEADYAGYDAEASHDQAYSEQDYAAAHPDYVQPGYDGQHDDIQHYGSGHHGGAEGGWSDDSHYLDYGEEEEAAPQGLSDLRRRLRPWHAAAAIGVVAVGSIAWQFLHRSGVGGSKEIAVINAPEGPVKIKPIAETDQDAPGSNGAAVLDRKDPTPVKQVVTHQEQAIDPTVSPKVVQLGDGPVDAPHETALGAQPRRVKTVTVRPDGSRVDDSAVPPAAVDTPGDGLPVEAPEPTGATPKPTTKQATTAQAAKPKAAPMVAMTEEAASAAATTTGAGFAVQFGAANSEAEARTLLKTVSSKYGVKATFKPAKVNGATIYRVRAANLTKDSANAICNKVKAAGGSCFVATN